MTRELEHYVTAYLDQASTMSFTGLATRQAAPFATIGTGAAGIAYMFLRAYRAGRGEAHLEHARRWAADAWTERDHPGAFVGTGFPGRVGSIAYGLAGVAFVNALVAHAAGAVAGRDVAIDQLLAICDRADGNLEVAEGAAGRLHALATLFAATGRERIAAVGDRIAGELAASTLETPAFADGTAGVLHAQLRWARARGLDATGTLAAIERLLDMRFGDTKLDHGWCAGSAGAVLVFALAFEIAQRQEFLAAAVRAAEHAAGDTDSGLDLCCGYAGRGYAMLAVDRIAPAESWRIHATNDAIAALATGLEHRVHHPNGLFKGHPGVVCLAIDLLAGGVARFPLVEE